MTALRSIKKGLTPHLFIYKGLANGKSRVFKYCAMVGCDVVISKGTPIFIGKEILFMTLPNWNALVFHIDRSYQI